MANRILIVDDAAFMRMMIRDILSKNGFEVVGEAQDGSQAIEKFKELRPDLITMDITMPEMDGIAALKEIKKWMPTPRLLCAPLWVSRLWLLTQSKRERRTLLLSHSKLTALLKPSTRRSACRNSPCPAQATTC